MYKLTSLHDTAPIYDSVFNTLSHHEEFLPNEHRFWKDDILLGKIYINNHTVRLILGSNEALNIPRDEFQKLFMTDASIVQLVFSAKEVKSVRIIFNQTYNFLKRTHDIRTLRLYHHTENGNEFFAELIYRLKTKK